MTRARVGQALLVAAAVFALTAVRAVVASRGELRRAQELEQREDVRAAIVHYRRAAQWYAPGNPYPADAHAALIRVATEREGAGDRDGALSAWRAVRGSALSVRWLRQPFGEELRIASAAIDRLMRESEDARELPPLPTTYGPHRGWSLALLFGFVLWVTGAFQLASASGPAPAPRRTTQIRAGMIVLGLLLFFVGLASA